MVRMTSEQSRALSLDLLFDRLQWPVPMVRWRAARGLRDLIEQAKTRGPVTQAFLARLAECEVESEVCSLLTILIMLAPGARPDAQAVIARIHHPSILADILLEHIYDASGEAAWWEGHSGDAPPAFNPKPYFEQYRRQHVPVMLSENFVRLERKTGLPFMRQWGFEWQELCTRTGARFGEYPYYFDDFGEVRAGIVGQYSLRQSEMFRSAYLRCFAIAVAQWGFPPSEAGFYVRELIPAIRGMFDLDPAERPVWLDDTPERCLADPDQLEPLLRDLITRHDSTTAAGRLVSLYAPLDPKVEPYGDLSLTAHLVSHDFRPKDACLREPVEIMIAHGFNFDRPLPQTNIADALIQGGPGDALAICVSVLPVPFGHWHSHYYAAGMPIVGSYMLPGDVSLHAQKDRIVTHAAQDELGITRFWFDRWTPRYPVDDGKTRCGSWATLKRDQLDKRTAALDRKLAWSARLRTWRREDGHGNYLRHDVNLFFLDGRAG